MTDSLNEFTREMSVIVRDGLKAKTIETKNYFFEILLETLIGSKAAMAEINHLRSLNAIGASMPPSDNPSIETRPFNLEERVSR